MNTIFLTPKSLMVLERITYIGALKKLQRIKEYIPLSGEWEFDLQNKNRISCPDYATYYNIELDHVLDAISDQRMLIIKPTDLILLEGVNNIKTASYRYERYLVKLNKYGYKLSINEYAKLNNLTVDYVLNLLNLNQLQEASMTGISSIEKEARELINQQMYDMARNPSPWVKGQ